MYDIVMKRASNIVYAFIDSQNLNLGTKSCGWDLDFGKFRLYLRNKYNVDKAYLFIGYVESNTSLYKKLQEYGYIIVFKPVLAIRKAGKIFYKGNVDAELVLHTMVQKGNYEKAIIVSGDGDFFCLVEYLEQHNLLYKIITPNNKYSSLLRKYGQYLVDLTHMKENLEKSRRHSRGNQG